MGVPTEQQWSFVGSCPSVWGVRVCGSVGLRGCGCAWVGCSGLYRPHPPLFLCQTEGWGGGGAGEGYPRALRNYQRNTPALGGSMQNSTVPAVALHRSCIVPYTFCTVRTLFPPPVPSITDSSENVHNFEAF